VERLTERSSLRFRPMTADDLRLLHEWLQRPHVKEWWSDHGTYDDVVSHYLPAIDGRDPTDHYFVEHGGRDVGMVETYLVDDHPDYARIVDVGPNVAGLDLFIADADLIGKGLGTEIISTFVDEVVFARPETVACVADPDARNAASIRAFEKAGFSRVRELVDATDGELHALLRRDR
jgi:RimJ/RimL family protein N-acetyltransferase